MGGFAPFGPGLSPNPIIRAKQEHDLMQRTLQTIGGANKLTPQPGFPSFTFPNVPVPAQPQAQPQAQPKPPMPQAPVHPPAPAGSTTQTAPDMRTQLVKDLQTQLAPGSAPAMPTYQAPVQQQDDPKRLLLEGLGMLFTHGLAGNALAGGIAQRQQQYADKYTADVQQAENAYNRSMTAYDRQTQNQENRIAHDVTGIDTIDKEAETAREHRVHDAAVQTGLKIKAEQVANQKSEAAQKLQASLFETAQRIGVDKSRIAEQYWAQSQRNAENLMAAGMRANTALNVAQLGATSRFVQAMWTGQNRMAIAKMQQSGMWDRLQSLQQNENARAAMQQLGLLVRQANNPKDPKAAAAVAQLEAQMGDSSSGIGQLMQQFQAMGIMSAPVGDTLQAEVDAETPMPGQGYPSYPMGTSFIAEPQQPQAPVTINLPNGGGTTMPDTSDVGAWIRMLLPGHTSGPSAAATPGAQHAQAAVHIPPEAVESARAWMSHYMGQEGPTAQNAEAAFQSMVQHGIVKGSPAEIQALHAMLVGNGAPNAKNSGSPPSLALPQVP